MTKTSSTASKGANKTHEQKVQQPPRRADSPRETSIASYAARMKVPFFRAAFRLSFPGLGESHTADYPWTLNRVSALETDAIVDHLDKLGIAVTKEAFQSDTASHRSAIDFAEQVWLARRAELHDDAARDFVRLAAHVLWTRWNEERPSREMAIEAMLHVANDFMSDSLVSAVQHGLNFWKFVAPELGRDVRTLKALQERLGAGRGASVLNTMADFAEAALEIAEDNPDLAGRVANMFEETSAQFVDESRDWHIQLLEDKAQLTYHGGDKVRGVRLLQQLIAGHPARAGAYVCLADLWACEDDAGKRRALKLLEEADAFPVEDGAEYDLDERIENLYREIEGEDDDLAPNYSDKPTRRLVRLLKLTHDDSPDELIDEIVRRGDEAVEPLRLIVGDEFFWDDSIHDEGILLCHAFRALGAIGSIAAARVLVEGITAHDDAPLPFEISETLEKLTPDAVPMLLEAAANTKLESETRHEFVSAAYEIAVKYPERRPDVAQFVTSVLRDTDTEMQSLVAHLAARIDDPATRAALDALEGNTDVLNDDDWAFISEQRELPTWQRAAEMDAEDLDDSEVGESLEIAIAKANESFSKARASAEGNRVIAPSTPVTRTTAAPKVGRNDPCPCGSGKKYKKCCLR